MVDAVDIGHRACQHCVFCLPNWDHDDGRLRICLIRQDKLNNHSMLKLGMVQVLHLSVGLVHLSNDCSQCAGDN